MNGYLKEPWMLCFSRTRFLRFISHLDWLAMVERILIRANLPVAYTEGYRPRIVMKASPPLPIGVQSECELLQVFLRDHYDPKDVAMRLSDAVPEDIDLRWVQHMRFKPQKNPYKAIVAAGYTIEFKESLPVAKRELVVSLLNSLKPESREDAISIGPDAETLKPVAGRLLEMDDASSFLEGDEGKVRIRGKMDPVETLHAAKLGFFLCETVPLTRFPRIVKTGYFRQTPKGLEPVFVR
jgi:hypothetical protein